MKQRLLSLFAMLSLMISGAMAQSLTVADITAEAGQEATITVAVEGAAQMTALQCNLQLPEGLTLAGDITLGDAAKGHTLSTSTLASGELLIVLYDLYQSTFIDGTLLTIPVVAAEEPSTTEGTLHKVRTATVAAQSKALSDVKFTAVVEEEEPEPKYYWYVGVTDPRTLTPGNVGNEVLDQWTEFTTEKESPVTVVKQDENHDQHIWYIAAPYDWKYILYNATGAASSEAGYAMSEATIDGVRYKIWKSKQEQWQVVGQLTITNHVPITAITLSHTAITMKEGEQLEVTATVTPENATNRMLSWVSSDESVADYYNGKVYAFAPGTATITVTDTDFYGNKASTSFTVTVEKKVIAVSGIALDQTAATLTEGETMTLKATVSPDDATDKTVTWSSSNVAVATVENGVVTALAAGTVTITAKAGDKTATCVVTVEAAAVEPEPEPEPTVASGEYYLYHAESKRFLARGEHWGACATVDRYGIPFVWTAEEYSLKFIDSNVHLFETDDSNIYTDNASTGFTFEEVEGGYLLKSQKSNRYLTIVDAAFTHQIVDVTDDASAAVVWQLKSKAEHDAIVAGYVEENYMNVIKAAGLTTTAGDFVSYLATLTAEDKTSAIGTARFNGSAGDWTFTEVRHQDWQPAYGADFCELWQATGSYTQTITGLAEGIYKVTVQGFERSGWWDLCVALGEKGYEITTATLSANGEEVNLKSWLSGKTDENNPDNTGQAIAKFNEGKYMNEVYTYVGADGTLTLTVCKPSHVGGNWIVFNNFTLTRYAEESTGIESSVLEAQGSQLIYDLTGRRVENPTKGIYIVNGKKVVIK